MVAMSSMYAWIGGSHIPEAKRSPPTTHLDALMITSIAMVKAMEKWCILLLFQPLSIAT